MTPFDVPFHHGLLGIAFLVDDALHHSSCRESRERPFLDEPRDLNMPSERRLSALLRRYRGSRQRTAWHPTGRSQGGRLWGMSTPSGTPPPLAPSRRQQTTHRSPNSLPPA